MNDCIDEETVAALFLGTLPDDERRDVEAHLSSCDTCRQVVSELARTSWGARAGGDALADTMHHLAERRADAAYHDDPTADGWRATTIGRYLVLERIGQGAMGVVLSAYDPELDRKVALKLVRGDGTLGPDGPARLQREAQAMARLEHPNVVRVYDLGVSGGRLFVAMELIDGVSLRAWLDEPRRPGEILEAFGHAGAGLAAAHDAGLVHGDFKPDNVLRARSGRVCVTDFGLAAQLERSHGPSPERIGADDARGRDGAFSLAIGGTPAYMAPELWRGERGGPASDQFAFCVALWEALTGVRPFAGTSLGELAASIERGERQPAPREKTLPAAVRAALARGLAVDPAARFPSMRALLDALGASRRDRRRRRQVAFAAGLAALGLAAGAVTTLRHDRAVCEGSDALAAAAFTRADQDAVATALRRAGAPFAEDTWRSVQSRLHGWLDRWSATRTAACQATRVRGEQSEELLDLRLQCLDRQLYETRALVEVLGKADRGVAERAVQAADSLPALDACADTRALHGQPSVPPAAKADVARVQRALAHATSLQRAGRYADALHEAGPLADEAHQIGYAPLEADALILRASLEQQLTQRDAAKKSAFAALTAAERCHADAVKARAAAIMAVVLGFNENHYDEGAAWHRLAEAALEHAPGETRLAIRLMRGQVALSSVQRRDADALAVCERALALAQRELPADDLDTAELLLAKNTVLLRMGRLGEAAGLIERVTDIRTRVLGPAHPQLVNVWINRGHVQFMREDFAGAVASYQRALDVANQSDGARERWMATLSLAEANAELGHWAEAEEAAQRGLNLLVPVYGASHPEAATYWMIRGKVALGQERFTDALADHRRAEDIYEKAIKGDHPALATALAEDGEAHLGLGQAALAQRDYERALGMFERTLGRENSDEIPSLVGLGRALLAQGNAAGALVQLERAQALVAKFPGGPCLTADVELELARALWQAGGDRERARALGSAARDRYHGAGERGARGFLRAERWLAAPG